MTDIVLYDAYNNEIKKKEGPYLQPDWFKSFNTLWASTSDAEKVASNPYELYSWVYACVNVLTRNIKSLTPIIYKKKDPSEIIESHPALDRIDSPNPMMNSTDLFESIILYLSLPTTTTPGGQAFLLPTDLNGEPVDLVKGIIPDYIWPASDANVSPVEKDGVFRGWEYKPFSNREGIFFYPSQIIRIRYLNPNNYLLGMSPFSAIRGSVVTDLRSRELSDKFFMNNASIGNILSNPARMDGSQIEKIKSEINEKFSGPERAGKLLVLHGGMKLEQMEVKSLSDLDFIPNKKFVLDEIIAAYGVNKLELGMAESINRATAEVEKELLWDNTLIPLIDKIWNGGLNPGWIKFLDKRDLLGGFDLSKVSALRRNTEDKAKTAAILIQDGMPPQLAWKTVGLKAKTDDQEWLEEPLVKGQRVNLRTGDTIGSSGPQESTPQEPTPEKMYSSKSMSREEKDLFWVEWVKNTQAKPEKSYKRMIVNFWVSQRNKFLDQADKFIKSKDFKTKAVASDFMIPKSQEDKILIESSEPIYVEGIKLQTIQMSSELGELVNWDITSGKVKRIISQRNRFLKGVNSTTFKTMGDEISTIIADNPGVSLRDLAKLIKEAEKAKFNAIIASNSKTVARTETASIANRTRFEIMRGENIKKHEWVTSKDEKVRPLHSDEDGHKVEIGKPFPSTGLIHPGQAGGDPGNVINCRCVAVAAE